MHGLLYRSIPVYQPAIGIVCNELYRAYQDTVHGEVLIYRPYQSPVRPIRTAHIKRYTTFRNSIFGNGSIGETSARTHAFSDREKGVRVLPRDGDRGDPARLGDGDRTGTGVPPTVQDLGELRALPGARLADDHDHRVLRHSLRYLVLELEDGEDRHGRGVTVRGWIGRGRKERKLGEANSDDEIVEKIQGGDEEAIELPR
ncbi:hypothetical protein B296_00037775 [Ensete ventricosum]|uniref:Uncharacterized protein n=1 Tax=Ensete ventricosum TaxID=4639 RepID=A0A426Z266_ENSVE|nr:hypothetical protein B296_00037775 [Ensete ventricosum]